MTQHESELMEALATSGGWRVWELRLLFWLDDRPRLRWLGEPLWRRRQRRLERRLREARQPLPPYDHDAAMRLLNALDDPDWEAKR